MRTFAALLLFMRHLVRELTIHGRAARLPYACLWLRERHIDFSPNPLDFSAANHTMDQPAAGRADTPKVASGVGKGDIFGHVTCRLLRRATRKAVDCSRVEAPPSRPPARLQEGRKGQSFENDGTLAVDPF